MGVRTTQARPGINDTDGSCGEDVPEYGLIAEEVAEIAPELVAYDEEGRPYSVRYHVLPSLLLNEMQKQQRTVETLLARVEELEKRSGAALRAQR